MSRLFTTGIWLLGIGLCMTLMASTPVFAASDLQINVNADGSLSFTAPPGSKTHIPKSIKPGLSDVQYIGTLSPHDDSMPYFLLAANPCKTCSAEHALYLIRPGEGSAAPKVTSFVQPGKIFDPRTRQLVMISRSFYGHCLGGRETTVDDVYVVFQKERVDRRHSLQSSVYIAYASPDFMRDKLIERGLPSLNRTLALVRARKCHEIEGRSRMMVLHPHGLDWRNYQPSDDDDQDRDDTTDDSQGSDQSGQPAQSGAPANTNTE